MRVLAVCLGNICRSPLAHGLLEAKAAELGQDWEVDSAGTGDYHVGDEPDPRSVAEAARHGLDNYRKARALASGERQRAKVDLIMNYAHPGGNRAVPDPYWDDDGFAGVYDMLARAVDGFAEAHPGGLPD